MKEILALRSGRRRRLLFFFLVSTRGTDSAEIWTVPLPCRKVPEDWVVTGWLKVVHRTFGQHLARLTKMPGPCDGLERVVCP